MFMKKSKPQNIAAQLPELSPVIQDGLSVTAQKLGVFYGFSGS
jgi:hypothetical protein